MSGLLNISLLKRLDYFGVVSVVTIKHLVENKLILYINRKN